VRVIRLQQTTDVYMAQSMMCTAFCCLLLMSVRQRTANEPTHQHQQQQQMARLFASVQFIDLMNIQPVKFTPGRRRCLSAPIIRHDDDAFQPIASIHGLREIYRTRQRDKSTPRRQ